MSTLATPHFEHPVHRLLDWLLPPNQQTAPPAPSLVQTVVEQPDFGAILAWLAVAPILVLFVIFLWPVLFAALIVLLVVLTPFVVGQKVLAAVKRGRHTAG